jgi:hypothetical protein
MWLYPGELQLKFEFRSGRMIFGSVMALELVFFVQILSCPDIYLTSFEILTWYLVCGAISRWDTVEDRISFRWNDCWLSYGPWTCIFCSNFNLSGLFFYVLWYIDLIFGMWLYLDELQFIFELRSGWMNFGWVMALELVFFVCSNCKLSGDLFDVLWYTDLIFGMWLYLDELQFKLEFRSGRMMFGWVMALELVFYVQILICPDFFFTSFEILTWYLVCGYI